MVKRRLVHLVICHVPQDGGFVVMKIHEAWESRGMAQSRARFLAQDDANKTKRSVRSNKTRVHLGASTWTVQKMVHNRPIGRSAWVSLRTWTTQAVPLKDEVIERLAKVVDAEA